MDKQTARFGRLAMVAMGAFLSGCIGGKVGDLRMESESVELGGAESAHVELEIGVGELRVSGGAKKLLEADFLYNVASWRPEVRYEVDGRQGRLSIKQPHKEGSLGNTRNEWNLALNNQIPMDLKIEAVVGKSNFDLGDLSLTRLDVQTGVGEATLDLIGDWKRNLDASIKGVIGQLTLRLPGRVGVHVEAQKGIGSIQVSGLKKEGDAYVNEAFQNSKVKLNFQIQAGIGEIRLEQATLKLLQSTALSISSATDIGDALMRYSRCRDRLKTHLGGSDGSPTIFEIKSLAADRCGGGTCLTRKG